MADRVIFDIGWVVDKVYIYTMKRSMIGVQCQLMICRGHIRASKGTFQIFLWLMVLWQIDILVQFCTLVFISSQI